jgi:hypothetical protein
MLIFSINITSTEVEYLNMVYYQISHHCLSVIAIGASVAS